MPAACFGEAAAGHLETPKSRIFRPSAAYADARTEACGSKNVAFQVILAWRSAAIPRHWLILPQYKEDVETIFMCLESVAQSTYAQKSIGIVLAMEDREEGAAGKVELVMSKFKGRFSEPWLRRGRAAVPLRL